MRHGTWIGLIFLTAVLGAAGEAAADQWGPATRHPDPCPQGSVGDIKTKTCWSCPAGYSRSRFPADGGNACERKATTLHQKGTRHGQGTGLLRTDCPRGQFWDPNGYCWSCPSGYTRTVAPVTDGRACAREVAASYARAMNVGGPGYGCPAGAFVDLGTGACWSCPKNWHRTINPIGSAHACTDQLHLVPVVKR
jgi:hypothetical protein